MDINPGRLFSSLMLENLTKNDSLERIFSLYRAGFKDPFIGSYTYGPNPSGFSSPRELHFSFSLLFPESALKYLN